MPRISVIIPVFKVDKYLKRCVDSVLNQTFDDFELILIDDGSTDKGGQICDEFALLDSRIIVIHKKNNGVSAARNDGILLSCGEYVTFIDSDDWISSKMIKVLYSACMKCQADISICRYDRAENESISFEDDSHESSSMNKREAIEYYFKLDYNREIRNGDVIRSPCGKLIRKEKVLSHLFPTDRVFGEDAACVYWWIWESDKIVDIPCRMYYYYYNADSVSSLQPGIHLIGFLQTEEEWIDFFQKYDFTELYNLACREYIESCSFFYVGVKRLNKHDEEKVFLRLLRSGIKKYADNSGINIQNCSEPYFQAWPIKSLPYRLTRRLKK